MSRIVKDKNNSALLVATKGAPEAIFTLCKLSKEETIKQLAIVESIAEQGFRVIAVAHGELTGNVFPESQTALELTFLGLIGLIDPIRKEVPQAIKECHAAGIEVIMITGDFPATAKNIANQIGLDSSKRLMTGDELKNLSDKHTDPNSGFSGWTPEMIQSQAAYTYHAESEDLIKLVVEMLVYKKIVTSKGVSINELQSFVDRVRSDKSDKIDTMIIESFDLAIQYEETYLKLKPSNYYY
jgi:hypothetical protein